MTLLLKRWICVIHGKGCDGHIMQGGLLIKDCNTLGSNSLELELIPGVIPPYMVHQVPLLTIGRVTVNAIELFVSIVYLLVSPKCVGPGEELATDVTGEVPEAIVNGIDVILK